MHRVLVVGVGSIGERHLRCFQATGRATLSLCELNADLAGTIAQRYGVPAHADLAQALAAGCDAAVIATPAHLHVAQALQIARGGAHLLIEKPLSTRLEQIAELKQAVEQARLKAAVAYVYRAHDGLAAMRQALLSGRFGQPLELVAVSGQHFPTYRPAYRQTYYARRVTGGGAIQDALTHVINMGEWLLGPVTRLVADAAHQALEGVEVEDVVHLLARHGGVPASYSLNQFQAPNETALTVICSQGTVRFEPSKNRWRWMISPGDDWRDETWPPQERDDMFVAQANDFLDVVEGSAEPRCTLDQAEQTLRVNLAALASLESAGWLDVP